MKRNEKSIYKRTTPPVFPVPNVADYKLFDDKIFTALPQKRR